jgi:uncharacterized protein (TIGR03000 family)
MYGIVLATMLTAGGEAPAWGWHSSCHGCYSSCHGCYSSCHGCWSSCYGCCGYSSCYGCCGYSSCHGCWSSCHGCRSYYYPVYYGCCSSCYGCCGGCCGGVVVVPSVIYPVASAPPAVVAPKVTQASVTIQVAEGATLSVDGKTVVMTAPSQTFVTPELDTKRTYFYDMKATAKKDGKELSTSKKVAVRAGEKITVDLRDLKPWKAPNPDKEEASLSVKLPAEAKLYVDGVLCPLTSAERVFETPPLAKGKQFTYTLKAELVREGKTLTETKRVPVEAGKRVSVEFGNLGVATASR